MLNVFLILKQGVFQNILQFYILKNFQKNIIMENIFTMHILFMAIYILCPTEILVELI